MAAPANPATRQAPRLEQETALSSASVSPLGSGGCVTLQVVPDSCSITGSIPPAVWSVPTAVQLVPDRHEAAARTRRSK